MKKFLLSLVLGFVGIISFCSSDYSFLTRTSYNFSSSNIRYDFTVNGDILCIMPRSNAYDNTKVKIAYLSGGFDNNSNLLGIQSLYVSNLFCINQDFGIELLTGSYSSNGFYLFSGLDDFVGSCDLMSSLDCQTNYNLIPISIVDQEYCEMNNLCSVGSGSCDGTGNWSALYINDIQHESAGIINIDIPSEINWDYTNEDNEFNLDVIGYNVDPDYIESIIEIQTSKPTKSDLNNIISGVIPLFVPGLVIILFIYFVFKFIKKLF